MQPASTVPEVGGDARTRTCCPAAAKHGAAGWMRARALCSGEAALKLCIVAIYRQVPELECHGCRRRPVASTSSTIDRGRANQAPGPPIDAYLKLIPLTYQSSHATQRRKCASRTQGEADGAGADKCSRANVHTQHQAAVMTNLPGKYTQQILFRELTYGVELVIAATCACNAPAQPPLCVCDGMQPLHSPESQRWGAKKNTLVGFPRP